MARPQGSLTKVLEPDEQELILFMYKCYMPANTASKITGHSLAIVNRYYHHYKLSGAPRYEISDFLAIRHSVEGHRYAA